MILSRPRAITTVLAASMMVGGSAFLGAASASAAAPPLQELFGYSGAPQSMTVPEGYCSVQIEVDGAAGGFSTDGVPGGLGARVDVTLPVHAGSVFTGDVGGPGTYEWGELNGGYGGGATGGAYISDLGRGAFAGGGGGRTTLSLDGNLVIVAGGGGGGGNSATGLTSGPGGDASEAGVDGVAGLLGGGLGGSAGGSGGAGGTNALSTAIGDNGQSAAGPLGGAGGDSHSFFAGAGGGGGGGVIGGGGGAASAVEGTSFETSPGGGGGGGGSSMGPVGATFSNGLAENEGSVSLIFAACDTAQPTPSPSVDAAVPTTSATAAPAVAGGGTTLAETGAASTPTAIFLGFAGLAGGLALLLARRRRTEEFVHNRR